MQYNSILGMRLKMEMDQQAQEKAEALQREQIADQKLQGYLNTMNQAGQLYYQSARARDKEERERAGAQIKAMREYEKEMRDRQEHNMDQLQGWSEMVAKEKGKGVRQQDIQLHDITKMDRPYELGRKQPDLTFKQQKELWGIRARATAQARSQFPALPSPGEKRREKEDQIDAIRNSVKLRTAAWDEKSDEYGRAIEKSRSAFISNKSFITGKPFKSQQEMIDEKNVLDDWIASTQKTLARSAKIRRMPTKTVKEWERYNEEMSKLGSDVDWQISGFEKRIKGATPAGQRGQVAPTGPTGLGAGKTQRQLYVDARRRAQGGGTPTAQPPTAQPPTAQPPTAEPGLLPFAEFLISRGVPPDSPEAQAQIGEYYAYLQELGVDEQQIELIMQEQGLL